ncbi:MAG: threonine synthase [Candidatus Cloacimonadaceae bacterium]|nr:threonine synthase [Candidatus Cloacimonadaceae bacterium]MDP3114811.1 threonine synthase [Candidatus Cloacimonadaceae bacterium]
MRYLCPACSKDYKPGMPLPGVLETMFDYAAIGEEWKNRLKSVEQPIESNWLIELFSAVELKYYPPLPVGNTPLFPVERLAATLGMSDLYVKNDGVNPSGSYKDRASQLIVAEANRLGIAEIVCASTGNAASSLACLCASAGKKAVIFAPAKAPLAKLVQIKIHGAELHEVDGTYDDAFARALVYSETHACLNRNTGYHPFTIEGKKTAGLEIFIQMGGVPDWIVVPVGDGVILAGIHKAFVDMKRTGIIDRLPRLLSVQNETSDAITSYWETGDYHDALKPQTVADSISVKTPSNAHWSVRALKETVGRSLRVSDEEILNDQSELARLCGVFAEPSCSATLSGLKAALREGWILQGESCVLLITGHGLKDINAVRF